MPKKEQKAAKQNLSKADIKRRAVWLRALHQRKSLRRNYSYI